MNPETLRKAERIKISDVFLLQDLASLGSIRETARLYRLAAPQVSRRLKIIERHFGFRFFERGVKGLVLTAEGTEALDNVKSVAQEFQAVLEINKKSLSHKRNSLGIAATSFLLSYVVVPALGQLMREEVRIRANLMAFNPDELLPSGMDGAFSMVLHPNPLEWPRSWQSELVGSLRWALFGRSGHPLAKKPVVREEVVAETPFVYPFSWNGERILLQNDGCPLPTTKRYSLIGTQTAEQALHVILQSDVVGFLPELMMRGTIAQGRTAEIKVRGWPRINQPVYLSVRADVVPNEVFKPFLAAVREVLTRLR